MDQAGLRTHELPQAWQAMRLPMFSEHSGIVRGPDSFTVAEAAPELIARAIAPASLFHPVDQRSPGHLKHGAKVRGLTPERQSRDRTRHPARTAKPQEPACWRRRRGSHMIGEGCIGLLAKASDQSHDRRGMNQVRQQAGSYGGVCSRVDGPGTGRDLHLATG
jgi:hypothetical protein